MDTSIRDTLLPTTLEALWTAIDSSLVVVGQDSSIRLANPAAMVALNRLGLRVGDLALADSSQVYADDGMTPLPAYGRPLIRALAGETIHGEEIVVRSPQGDTPRRIYVSAYPFRDAQDEAMALVSWRDVTARWQVEEERAASLTQMSRLLEGAADYAIMMLDPGGRVMTWSASAERLHGYTATEVVGHPHLVFYPEQDQQAGIPARMLLTADAAGRAVQEGNQVRGDGSAFRARAVITALRGADGELHGFVRVTHDVTAEHEAQQRASALTRELVAVNDDLERRIAERTRDLRLERERLLESNRELEAFSFSVSHDLRAPLRSINSFAQLLADTNGEVLDAEGRDFLARIQGAGQTMGELIEGLLHLATLHDEPPADQALDMTALARQAWDSVAPTDRAVTVSIADLPPARGDRRLIAQVWTNLLENAVKFTARCDQARIEVYADVAGPQPGYRVVDNGAGFDMQNATRLFTPFRRLHRAQDYPGTGIGLALVDRIVRKHGGTISVVSAPDRGAAFTFTLNSPTSGAPAVESLSP